MIKLALTRLSRCGGCLEGRKCCARTGKAEKNSKGSSRGARQASACTMGGFKAAQSYWNACPWSCVQRAGGACGKCEQVGQTRPAEKQSGVVEVGAWVVRGEAGEMAAGGVGSDAQAHAHWHRRRGVRGGGGDVLVRATSLGVEVNKIRNVTDV